MAKQDNGHLHDLVSVAETWCKVDAKKNKIKILNRTPIIT